jgi:ectoine hydroxylase-related dioxygenase (phytanoyl-CoA dioxygenase family)
LPEFSDPHYVKFRYSNNNNSIDASVFHQDDYNYTDSSMSPIYTALCYIAKAELELIPGSLIKNNLSLIDLYKNKKVIHLEKGDIVIINSNLYHKGVNFSKGANRRVLQVFTIYPNKEVYREYNQRFKVVNTSNNKITKTNLLYYASQNETALYILNIFMLLVVYLGIQYKITMMDIPPSEKEDSIISYEPSGRVYYKDGLIDDINVNIIVDDSSKVIPYSRYYLFLFLFFIIGFLLIYVNLKKK